MSADPLSSSEVAALIGKSYRTVIRMAERGELPSMRVGSRGDYVFDRADVVTYLAERAERAQDLADLARLDEEPAAS